MSIYREVTTEVYCDVCGEKVIAWNSTGNGVSKIWAGYFARLRGCTVGKKVVCKQCRIKKRIEKCNLRKRYGCVEKDENGACLGIDEQGKRNLWSNANTVLRTLLLTGKKKGNG